MKFNPTNSPVITAIICPRTLSLLLMTTDSRAGAEPRIWQLPGLARRLADVGWALSPRLH